jgi:hypothetical protein
MRIYDMRCLHDLCGRVFDWHIKPAIYERSSRDGFRDVRCGHCGRLGAKRAWKSAPANITPQGEFGKYASPGLKGKSYYGKEERDRLLKAAGSSFADDGSSRDCGKKKEVVNETQRDRARSAIEKLLDKNGQMRLKDIISESGLGNSAVNDVIYKDPGRIIKTGWGLYGLSGVEYETGASAS